MRTHHAAPHRTRLLRGLLVLGVLAIAGCNERPAIDRPNIVFVIADDYGYPYYGFMGSRNVRTPHLDSLAESGTVFTHAHNTASVCRPSQLTFLTGLHPYRWDRQLSPLSPRERRRAIERVDTLPRLLAKRGYASFQGGKYWEGSFEMGGFTAGMAQEPPIGGNRSIESANNGRRLMMPVMRFIEDHPDQPFFVWFAPSVPHIPFKTTREIERLYRDVDLPDGSRSYFEACTYLDSLVGELIDFLERRRLRENTLVVYASDNGWEPGQQRGVRASRGKGSLHELGLRTPLIFNWPGRVPAGQRIGELISTLDVVPTLLDFAGVTRVAHLQGDSLRPQIASGQADGDAAIVGSMRALANRNDTDTERSFYARTPRWHLIVPDSGAPELYDKTSDPDDDVDEASEHPDVVAELRSRIDAWKKTIDRPVPGL